MQEKDLILSLCNYILSLQNINWYFGRALEH